MCLPVMTGVPWELNELPRQLHPKPHGDIFGQPPVRPARTRKPKAAIMQAQVAANLGTISERESAGASAASRVDAGTSTTDLTAVNNGGTVDELDGESPKKVQRGQINALAKLLLRR
jgi:hypothetical protein